MVIPLLLALLAPTQADLPCSYAAGEQAEMLTFEHCADYDPHEVGVYRLRPEHGKRLAAGAQGGSPATLYVGDEPAYLAADGRAVAVLPFDNGPDAFSEGLVRALRDGDLVYLDASLRPAFPRTFGWGWPFEGGLALVCVECRQTAPDDEGHRSVEGGRWGVIDRQGRDVLPLLSTREQAEAWLEGRRTAGTKP
jgi:hypothetical protein